MYFLHTNSFAYIENKMVARLRYCNGPVEVVGILQKLTHNSLQGDFIKHATLSFYSGNFIHMEHSLVNHHLQ